MKLNLSMSITLPIPNQDFGSHKVEVTCAGLDVEGDVEAQLQTWFASIPKAAPVVEQGLDQVLANLTGHAIEGLGLSQDVSGISQEVADARESVTKLIEVLRNHKERLAALEGGAEAVVPIPVGAVKVTVAPDERPEAAPQVAPTVQEGARPVVQGGTPTASDPAAKPTRRVRRTKAEAPAAAPAAEAPAPAATQPTPVATPAPVPALAPPAPAPVVSTPTQAAPSGEENNPFRK